METLLSKEVDWKKVVVVSALVGLAALVSGVIVWYYMDQQLADQTEYYEEQLTEEKVEEVKEDEAEEEAEEATEEDEAAAWKTYDGKYFSFKYPSEWKVIESSGPNTSGDYSNVVFANDRVIVDNATAGYAIGLNIGEIFGRGGACVARTNIYNAEVVNKKLSLELKEQKYEPGVTNDDYCGDVDKKGYAATTGSIEYGGNNFFFHSEDTSVSDAVAKEAIGYFKEILETVTFK